MSPESSAAMSTPALLGASSIFDASNLIGSVGAAALRSLARSPPALAPAAACRAATASSAPPDRPMSTAPRRFEKKPVATARAADQLMVKSNSGSQKSG